MDTISARAKEIFDDLFSEKLFRAQLSFYDDVDYSEKVEYIIDTPPSNDEVKSVLTRLSTDVV